MGSVIVVQAVVRRYLANRQVKQTLLISALLAAAKREEMEQV